MKIVSSNGKITPLFKQKISPAVPPFAMSLRLPKGCKPPPAEPCC
jgi:hypothetical protein